MHVRYDKQTICPSWGAAHHMCQPKLHLYVKALQPIARISAQKRTHGFMYSVTDGH